MVFAEEIMEALAVARKCTEQAQLRQKHYADRKRRAIHFQKGDQVLLATKHLRLTHEGLLRSPRRKLLPRFVGPFAVKRVISDTAYELDLPSCMKCHPVFHVSLLRSYTFPHKYATPPPPPDRKSVV